MVSATGTAAKAGSALRTSLARSGSFASSGGSTEQITSTGPISVPVLIAGSVLTVRVAPAIAPKPLQQPQRESTTTAATTSSAGTLKEVCPAYYGQLVATGVPRAFGKVPTWAPCGYLPQQVAGAYGATRSG